MGSVNHRQQEAGAITRVLGEKIRVKAASDYGAMYGTAAVHHKGYQSLEPSGCSAYDMLYIE